MKSVIKSISYSNTEILNSINKLYLNNKGFDLDPTYSKGNFYKDFPEPKYISDLQPLSKKVTKADCTNLGFGNNELNSICFDPPFLHGTAGQRKNNHCSKRFSLVDTHSELLDLYNKALKEFYRILKIKGILAFKCQDYTDTKTYFNHNYVYNFGIETGFQGLDLFILLAKSRIFNPNLTQRHSRKFHSYWYVFKK